MAGFKLVNNASEITLNNKWAPATKFNSKDRLVDEKGHTVSSDYKGHQYRIIEKRERTFSGLERLERGFLGTLAVVCTLCFALFSKSVRNLFTKSKASIRFAILESKVNLQLSQRGSSLPKAQSDEGTLKLESIEQTASWEDGAEPGSLPENWKKHQAEQNIIVDYGGSTVTILKGENYFTYQGKVAIGWHGSYNPPCGM